MWDTFGQDPRRSIFERFHLFMNCCNMFFHVILDWKLNVSKLAESLAARIVWCCAYVGHFWPRSVTFNFWVSFSILLQEIQKEDWKLNLSDTAQTLATRIVWCCADVGHFWPRSEAFNFWKVSSLHELLQRVLSCYSWLKIEYHLIIRKDYWTEVVTQYKTNLLWKELSNAVKIIKNQTIKITKPAMQKSPSRKIESFWTRCHIGRNLNWNSTFGVKKWNYRC